MKNVIVGALVLSIATAACGTPGDQPEATSSRESPIVDDTLPIVDDTLPSVDDVAEAELGPLSIDDALLRETDAPEPWSPQGRNLDTFAYDIGGNQTDCEPYWQYEQLTQYAGGELLWWRDGGNLNNYVRRVGADTGPAMLALLADLPNTCTTTSWSEGDFFTIEPLDLDVDHVVGLSFVDGSDQTTWLAFAQHGDLLGELRLTLWPEFETDELPPVSIDDFAATATLMRDRLRSAGADTSPPTTTTTTTTAPVGNGSNGGLQTTTTLEPGTNPSPIPSTTTVATVPGSVPATTEPFTPPTTTTTLPLDPNELGGLAPLLLADDDLDDGWSVASVTPYTSGSDGEEPFAGCLASMALNEFDDAFEFEADLAYAARDLEFVSQWIGRFADQPTADATVEQFATIGLCDLTDEMPGAVFTSQATTVAGADAAALFSFSLQELEPGFETIIIVATVGDITTSVSVNANTSDGLAEMADDLIARAVAKISAS